MGNSEVEDYIAALKSSRKFGIQIVCHKTIEPVPADYAPLPGGLHPGIEESLKKAKISRLYLHQSRAIELVQRGKDVVVATPTASGKSLVYHIPTLQRYLDERDSRALYMFPLKALA
ncbi:MAG: DEAD/DEAH box helicase, partial [Desulfofustis sp.]|nr:DEAD/DEAH box helicase [Desulfofustis sp.]